MIKINRTTVGRLESLIDIVAGEMGAAGLNALGDNDGEFVAICRLHTRVSSKTDPSKLVQSKSAIKKIMEIMRLADMGEYESQIFGLKVEFLSLDAITKIKDKSDNCAWSREYWAVPKGGIDGQI